MFDGPFRESILRRAQDEGRAEIRLHDLRTYTLNKHGKVDDYPFGGGAGLVMNVEPIDRALQAVRRDRPRAHTVLMSPSGRTFDQKKAWEFSRMEEIILICGRYEGVDARVSQHWVDAELSVGDFVLSGGEIAAMAVVDAVARLVPGVVGAPESLQEESFHDGLLEYPQYTRPREYKGHAVPEVLVSGNHQKIREWQRREALKKTARNRPDLLRHLDLTHEDRALLKELEIG
ncbi:MAG: tRNA (guanosine(37)-N1)-methyltransferase TrmD [Nitrospinaceae bacterium]